MKWLLQLVVLTLVVTAGTWFVGWWFVPLAGAVFGAWAAHERSTVLSAMLAGAFAWGALLAYNASVGPVDRLLQVFSAMFHGPAIMMVVLTISYAALLCATAAALARALRHLMSPA